MEGVVMRALAGTPWMFRGWRLASLAGRFWETTELTG